MQPTNEAWGLWLGSPLVLRIRRPILIVARLVDRVLPRLPAASHRTPFPAKTGIRDGERRAHLSIRLHRGQGESGADVGRINEAVGSARAGRWLLVATPEYGHQRPPCDKREAPRVWAFVDDGSSRVGGADAVRPEADRASEESRTAHGRPIVAHPDGLPVARLTGTDPC